MPADDYAPIADLYDHVFPYRTRTAIDAQLEPPPEFTTPDGRRVVRCHKTTAQNRFRQTGRFELIYDVTHPDGRTERLIHAFDMRYLFRFEAEHLLARAGFEIEHL